MIGQSAEDSDPTAARAVRWAWPTIQSLLEELPERDRWSVVVIAREGLPPHVRNLNQGDLEIAVMTTSFARTAQQSGMPIDALTAPYPTETDTVTIIGAAENKLLGVAAAGTDTNITTTIAWIAWNCMECAIKLP